MFEKRNYEAGSVKALYAEGVGVQNEVLSYDFTVDADTQYDIWILGTQLDKTYLTRSFMDIDNSDIPLEEEYQFSVDGDTKSDPIYKVNDDWGEVFWQKNVRPKTISAGKHTLYINFCERQLSGGKQYGVFDAIVIVPASWEWEPEKGTVLEDNTLLDAYAADNYMFSKYGSGVKDNIVFPEGVAPGGSTLNLNRRTKML